MSPSYEDLKSILHGFYLICFFLCTNLVYEI